MMGGRLMKEPVRRIPLFVGLFSSCLVRPVMGSEPETALHSPEVEARSVGERADLARRQGHLGLAAYAEGRWQEALRHFTEAERWMHSPVFVLYMARCQQELGAVELARELYRKAAEEPLSDDAPDVWRDAQASAQAALEALEAPESQQAEQSTIDPNAGEDEAKQKEAKWEQAPAPPPAHSLLGEHPTERVPPYRYGAYVALGAGALGLAVGTVAGSLAWSQAEDIKQRCHGTSCLVSDEAKAHEVRRLAHVATVGFVVAATGAAVGITLWLLPVPGERNVALRVEPTSASITGRF